MALTKIGATLGGSADVIQVTQSSHGLTLGYPVKMTSSGYAHATADTAANAEAVGIIIATTTNTLTIALGGRITVDGCVPNLTAGTVLFLQVSAGLLAAAEPSTVNQVSKPMAVITIANSEMLMVQQRGEVVSTGTATIADGSIDNDAMADDAVGADELAANAVVNDSIASGAAIDATKIADGSVTSTEFQYINTLSSNAQDQIAAKAPIDGASLTGTTQFATLSDGTIAVTAWADEDNMGSNSPTLVPTQQSVKAYVDSTTSDTAYASSWDGVTTIAPSKNAVYDKIETLPGPSDTAYASSWNGVTTIAPSKNAVYDKIETMGGAWEILSTVEASSSPTYLTITDIDPSEYNYFKLEIADFRPNTGGGRVQLQMGSSAGFRTGGSDYHYITAEQKTNQESYQTGFSSSYIRISSYLDYYNVGTGVGNAFAGSVTMNLGYGESYPMVFSTGTNRSDYGTHRTHSHGNLQSSTGVHGEDITQIRIRFHNGTIAKGVMTLFGAKAGI